VAQLGSATQTEARLHRHPASDGFCRSTRDDCVSVESAFWGYGYAQEACRRLLKLLFAVYHVEDVRAEVDTRNHASWTLLERLGFRRIVIRQAADHFKGESSDEYTYELTDRMSTAIPHWLDS
jgi:RimJ/RimL family protein N-acetyltransferase